MTITTPDNRQKFADGRTKDGVGYCPYTETSQHYDTRRKNPGLNIIIGSLATNSDTKLNEMHVLDVGCGTGSFIEQILPKVSKVTGVEYNDGMIAKAKARLGDRVRLVQGSAQELPFEDATFDAVTINQVIHHFDRADNYQEFLRALQEIQRVLKPGGVFVLNTSTPEQQRDAFWWLELFPEQSVRQCARFPPMNVIKQHMKTAGFNMTPDSITVTPERPLMNPDLYLDADPVVLANSEAYRACDSSWAMPEQELAAGLRTLEEMQKTGAVSEFLERKERQRLVMGQATFVSVQKM